MVATTPRTDAGRASSEPASPRLSGSSTSTRFPPAAAAGIFPERQEAIDALRRHVAAHTDLPTAKHRTEGLPSFGTIRRLFGGWNAYVQAAGFTPRPYRAWNRADTIAAIQQWAQQHQGKPPSRAEWPEDAETHPSYWLVRRLFGTWSSAIQQAGLVPQKAKQVHWTDAAILDALRRWADAHGVPSSSDWSARSPGRPTHALVVRRFGSWEAALLAAGLQQPAAERWSAEQIIDALQSWAQINGQPPCAMDWKRAAPEHPNRVHVWKRFGSWNMALQAAGLPTSPERPQ